MNLTILKLYNEKYLNHLIKVFRKIRFVLVIIKNFQPINNEQFSKLEKWIF